MNYNLRLPDEVYAEMERLSKEHDRSLNSEIIQASRAWIREHSREKTFYVKLGTDGQPTGEFRTDRKFWNEDTDVEENEQWATLHARDIDELQEKMKVFHI